MDDSQSFTAFTVSTVGHDIGNLVSEAASEVACGMSVLAQGTGASRGEDFGAASVRILGTGEVVNCQVPAQTTDDRFDGTTGGTHGRLVAALLLMNGTLQQGLLVRLSLQLIRLCLISHSL